MQTHLSSLCKYYSISKCLCQVQYIACIRMRIVNTIIPLRSMIVFKGTIGMLTHTYCVIVSHPPPYHAWNLMSSPLGCKRNVHTVDSHFRSIVSHILRP